MSFAVTTVGGKAGDKTGDVFELADAAGTVRAEVWPFCGFNCLKWQTRLADGSWGSILFTAPDWETNPVPTRSGHPILFPFPGRLRGGTLHFEGKTYQVPLNEASGRHAIHGFTPRNPWRVVNTTASADAAEITGQFQLSKDLPESLKLWPSDFILSVTYRLTVDALTVTARIENPGERNLPFGLGYHAYFTIPGGDEPVDRLFLRATASGLWEAEGNIPTGNVVPASGDLDFRTAKAIGATHLDHVYTTIDMGGATDGALATIAELSSPDRPGKLTVQVSPWFRELVLFTPPHRKAVAIEPYTCAGDAATLNEQGVDAGWVTLAPGAWWQESVAYRYEAK